METRHASGSGQVRHVALTASKMHVGEVEKVCVFCRDITERKELDDALYHSLNMWQTSFNALPAHISILDENGKIRRANRAMSDAFVGAQGQLEGLDFRQLYCGDEQGQVELPHESVLSGRSAGALDMALPKFEGWHRLSAFPLYGRMDELVCYFE